MSRSSERAFWGWRTPMRSPGGDGPVVVFERSPQAAGASVRNFGMIWPIGQPAGHMHEMALRSRDLWVEVLQAARLPYFPTGSLHVVYREDEAAVAREFCEVAPGLGYACEWLGASGVAGEEPGGPARRTARRDLESDRNHGGPARDAGASARASWPNDSACSSAGARRRAPRIWLRSMPPSYAPATTSKRCIPRYFARERRHALQAADDAHAPAAGRMATRSGLGGRADVTFL